jgi:hypothetical protein
MSSKIISLPHVHFLKPKKQPPLSKKMIEALQRACSKQHAGIPFGQAEIDGSFLPLINRGLLKVTPKNKSTVNKPVWQVSEEAIDMLRSLGIKIEC